MGAMPFVGRHESGKHCAHGALLHRRGGWRARQARPQMILSVIAFSTARVRSRVPSLSRMVDT